MVCSPGPTSCKVSIDLGCCEVFIQLYSAIAVLATCPWSQGYRKSRFFCTNGWSVVNPSHLTVAFSGANRSIGHPLYNRQLRGTNASLSPIYVFACCQSITVITSIKSETANEGDTYIFLTLWQNISCNLSCIVSN
jgi:hypothetical protein